MLHRIMSGSFSCVLCILLLRWIKLSLRVDSDPILYFEDDVFEHGSVVAYFEDLLFRFRLAVYLRCACILYSSCFLKSLLIILHLLYF